MKKSVSLLLALLMLFGMMSVPAMAADNGVKVYLFGEKLEFDVPPQIIYGRTMVPMRAIFEALGATVDWNGDTKTVTSTRGIRTIKLAIDSNLMYVNGSVITLDVPPCIVDGRTMVPARAVSESLGLDVDWDSATKSVLITKSNSADNNIAAQIGDYSISEAYYNCCYYVCYSQFSQYAMYYGEDWLNANFGGKTIADAIKEEAVNYIELMAAAGTVAKRTYGINGDSVKAVVDSYVDAVIEGYGGQKGFEEFLSYAYTTEAGIREYFTMIAISELLIEKASADGNAASVSEADVEMTFNLQYDGMMKVQHILIATQSLDGYSPSKTDAEAKAIANEVIAKLKKGEDFGKLITEYNEDPGQTADSFYVFGDGEMVEEFEAASKKLTPGAYTTQAVKTAYGYHIIKRYPLDKTSEEYKNCRTSLVEYALSDVIEKERANMSKDWK